MMKSPYLIQMVNGVQVSKQLCTNNFHANNIIIDRMLELDPFLRNGRPIVWVEGGIYSHYPRGKMK